MKQTIYFDMDGTIVDLYNQPNWLQSIREEQPNLFYSAKPIIDIIAFKAVVKQLRKRYYIGIISWTPMHASVNYCSQVMQEKKAWINHYLPKLIDVIYIVPFGTDKTQYLTKQDILIDDSELILKECEKNNFTGIHANLMLSYLSKL